MFESLKLWKLTSAISSRNDADAYSAILELGRSGSPKAVEILIEAVKRGDGVARAAARELGRLGDARAVQPLVGVLGNSAINESAAEALLHLGVKAVDVLLNALRHADPLVRYHAAVTLGNIGDKRAVEPLIEIVQGDNEYSVRTAAATALGQLKDARAVWVLVGTLKLRDEASKDRQAALAALQQACNLAMRKIGDPLTARKGKSEGELTATIEKLEEEIKEPEVHPRLLADVALLSEPDLIGILRELVMASEEVSWAKLESREPLLPHHFKTYDQRRIAAEMVGTELHRRGGTNLLHQVLGQLNQHATIKNWWAGLGV